MSITVRAAFYLVLLFAFALTAEAAEVRLKSLNVKSQLMAGVPYDVNIPLSHTGHITDVKGCFFWSEQGPFCFPPLRMNNKNFYIQLYTGNPGSYELRGLLKFKDENGRRKQSNAVTKIITVR